MKKVILILLMTCSVLWSISKDKKDVVKVRCTYEYVQTLGSFDSSTWRIDTMTLDIGDIYSHYYGMKQFQKDSILRQSLNIPNIQSISVIKNMTENEFNQSGPNSIESSSGERSQIFRNKKTNEFTTLFVLPFSNEKYRCKEKIELKWEIENDTATILGYLCQKARVNFRGREYIVWFAPSIALNEGPWKFSGLPGMIVKVNDVENQFRFSLIGIESHLSQVVISIPDELYIDCSYKDINKVMQNEQKTRIEINGGNITIKTREVKTSVPLMEIE